MSEYSKRMDQIRSALESSQGDDRRAIVPMTYNLAADTWGGWEEAESVTAADKAIGLQAAQLNIDLAEEHKLGPERRKNGYWILGAHLLEQGHSVEAEAAFTTSHQYTLETDDEAAQFMTRGWIVACQLYRGESQANALDEIESTLRTLGEDGEFYAAQYRVALDKFADPTNE